MNFIYVENLKGCQEFLDFWKLGYRLDTRDNPAVSIVENKPLDWPGSHSLIMQAGEGIPGLYRVGEDIFVFARVRRVPDCPPNLRVVAPIFDQEEKIVSYVLENPERKTVWLPFALSEVFDGFQRERYLAGKRKTFLPPAVLRLYYFAKKVAPAPLLVRARSVLSKVQGRKKFPRWPLEPAFENLKRFVLKLLVLASKEGEIPFVWFWPAGKETCLVLTHDVEKELTTNGGIGRLLACEKKFGFRSAFNVVPFKYRVNEGVLAELKRRGSEIGVHGYSHDARLFESYKLFEDRIRAINEVARKWGATGFRSAATYRNADWYRLMEFDYDSSFFDTDPYEPQPGGCLSLFPFFLGKILEIPLTLPQDFTLFTILKERDTRIWADKVEKIREMNGLVCIVAHPDRGYIGDEDKIHLYSSFLKIFHDDSSVWNPLPRELARWWRARKAAELIITDGKAPELKNGLPEMSIRVATVTDDKLVFQPFEKERFRLTRAPTSAG